MRGLLRFNLHEEKGYSISKRISCESSGLGDRQLVAAKFMFNQNQTTLNLYLLSDHVGFHSTQKPRDLQRVGPLPELGMIGVFRKRRQGWH
jgi:hypothetical protein